MSHPIVWLEIPVSNFDRAVNFYEKVFQVKLEITFLYDKKMALFTKEHFGVKGSLIETDNYTGSNGMKPFYYVTVMADAINSIKYNLGKVITEPSLLRQRNRDGDVVIGTNLIDNQIGYYAEVCDSEGNHFYIYSHS